MDEEGKPLKVVESSHVSPPPGSVPTNTTLRLTFFDLPWFPSSNMQRLYFYEFPYPTSHFIQTILPLLKHSLSLTLRHFFPLAADIVCPLPPGRPYIRYKDGDSVALTVVESPADFHHVVADYPRDVKVLHHLVPPMPNAPLAEEDGTRVLVLTPLAFQVTVFPNVGLCIGYNYCHVIGDGKTFSHFMRHWTDVYTAASGGDDLTCTSLEKSSLPLLDRDVIKDPVEADSFLLKMYHGWISSYGENPVPTGVGLASNNVRATFMLVRADIERLKQLVTSQWKNEAGSETEQFHVSTFVVTCAFIWASLIKSKESTLIKSLSHDDDDDELYYLLFPFDCRNRLEFPVPETYFGNCLNPGIVEMKKKELIGENGIVMAAKTIGRKVKEMVKSGLIGAENWIPNLLETLKTGRLISVTGSPRFRVYDTEFGLGRPRKVEMVHVESGSSIYLTEYRAEEGGIEVSLGMSVNQMNQFVSIFEKSLKLI